MTGRLPIRWRLTIWYAALLAAALAVTGIGLYLGLRVRLYDTFEEQARNQAALTLSTVRVEAGAPRLDPATEANLRDDEHFVRLLDAGGRTVVDTGASLGGVPLDPTLVDAALAGTERRTYADSDEGRLLVVTAPVRAGDEVVGVLQVGSSREDTDEVLGTLLLVLAVVAPLALVLTAGGGYLLAGRALAPVAAITTLAAGIGAGDLGARLRLDLPDDELGRLARTFDGMLARIEGAFERQRRFAGDAAHELRTPLSLMRGQVDLALARPRSDAEYQEALRGLDGDLARISDLVGTLLALARSDAGRLPLDRAPVDLAATIGLVLEQYMGAATGAGVTLGDESAPASIVADQDLLVQVLVNLLDNALAHTPPGGRIAAGCRRDGGQAVLWVADTGAGIAPEHQGRVFDRFYRVDTGRARERGGVGLGLALCAAVAEAHGGTIALESAIGRGTRVEMRLPASA